MEPIPFAQVPPTGDITPRMILASEELCADHWKDAKVYEVIRYLRGGLGLQMPEDWLEAMPPCKPQRGA